MRDIPVGNLKIIRQQPIVNSMISPLKSGILES